MTSQAAYCKTGNVRVLHFMHKNSCNNLKIISVVNVTVRDGKRAHGLSQTCQEVQDDTLRNKSLPPRNILFYRITCILACDKRDGALEYDVWRHQLDVISSVTQVKLLLRS